MRTEISKISSLPRSKYVAHYAIVHGVFRETNVHEDLYSKKGLKCLIQTEQL